MLPILAKRYQTAAEEALAIERKLYPWRVEEWLERAASIQYTDFLHTAEAVDFLTPEESAEFLEREREMQKRFGTKGRLTYGNF